MTKEFIKGFMHEDNTIDADAKFFSGDINIMTTEEFKSFSEDDNVEYVGFMEFTDGSMMDFYSKTVKCTPLSLIHMKSMIHSMLK